MSKTIDQRVVEMQFDNRQFESGVKTSMSTIDRLKQKLNFKDAGKSFENISAAAKKVDMNGLAKSVDTVKVQFSSLQVVATTALANITNAAVNAGKNLVNSLTLAPITSGFQEYETQMNAIQTILANTQSKGSTLEDVKSALAELNEYADQTIYNFTEMTRNIGTFTAAGVGLEESVSAIKGIANLAAVSGSSSLQASQAMYQLSQALAAGRVSLMDWNSVVSAGMGGEVFQQALIRTARVMGTGVDQAIEKYGTFRESLTKGQWLTAEVLTETLSQIAGAYDESTLLAQGYSKEQAAAILQLAETATGAATDVKTFTQLWDTTQEAIGSGWAQTWQLIIGDFEEAKVFFSGIKDLIDPVVSYFADSRNDLLAGALSSNWEKMISQINEAGVETADFNEELEKTVRGAVKNYDDLIERNGSLANAFRNGELNGNLIIETLNRMAGVTDKTGKATEDMSGKLEYFQKVVNEVWNGDYKNGEERIKALADAGYDYAQVQALVNKIVDGHKLTLEDLGDAQLKAVGYTDEEVKALRELAKQAEATGTPLNELINNLTKKSGREYLQESITNLVSVVIQAGSAIGKAWQNIFPPMASTTLYNMIKGFSEFTASLANNTDAFDKIRRSFEGLFAILDLVTTILGGGFKLALTIIGKLLGNVDLSILDLTAILGDAAVALRNFILDNELVNKGFDLLASGFMAAVQAVKGWIDAFLDLPFVQSGIENFKNTLSNLKQVGIDAIEGLKEGLQNGITSVPQILMEIGQKILDTIKNVLGIHSPSTEMYDVGEFTIEGFINGFADAATALYETGKEVFLKFIDVVKEVIIGISFGDVLAAAISVSLIVFTNRILNIVDSIVAPLEGLGDVLSGVGDILSAAAKPIAKTIKGVANVLNGFALQLKAKAVKDIAIAIAILAGSLFVLAQLPADRLWSSVGAIAALAVSLGVLTGAVGKFGPKGATQLAGMALAFIGIGGSLLLMANSLKALDSLNPDKLAQTLGSFALLVVAMMALLASMDKMGGKLAAVDAAGMGFAMLELSVSLMIMARVIKTLGSLDRGAIIQGGVAIAALMGLMTLLGLVGGIAGQNANSFGSAMLKISVSLYLLIGVIKLLAMIDPEEIAIGMMGLTAFAGVISLLGIATRLAGKNATKLGTSLLAMSVSLYLLVGVVALLAKLDPEDMRNGMVALTEFTGIIGLMLLISRLGGKEASKVASTILSMSLSVGVLAGIAVLLSLIDLEGLQRGITAVGILSTFMALMIAATKNTENVTGNLVAMSVAIGLMAAAVAGLSFIEPTKLITATASMTILMGMFALVEKAGSNIQKSMGSLIVMTTAVGLLGGILIAMGLLPLEGTLEKAAALSLLMASLSASMLMISNTGKTSSDSVSPLMGMAAVLGIIAASILGVLAAMDIEPSIESATALSILLLGLTAVTIALGVAGKAASGASAGAIALVKVVGILGLLLGALGALNSIPGVQEFVDKGIPLLNSIASGLGQAIGNIISGLGIGITAGLPAIADNLTNFMTKMADGFAASAKAFDADVLAGVGYLAGAIIALTAAQVISGIGKIFSFGTSFADIGKQLVDLGTAMHDFSVALGPDFSAKNVQAAAAAGEMLASLNKSFPSSGGLLQGLLGEKTDLGTFGTQLKNFGKAIADFSSEVSGKIDEEGVTAAANAGKILVDLNKSLPRQGGALQEFLGSQDLSVFGDQLKKFGEAIVDFSQEVSGNIDEESVKAATNAGTLLAELNNKLPRQGGALQEFLGSQDLSVFGDQLKKFGEAIVDFSAAVSAEGAINPDAIQRATDAAEIVRVLNEKLPKQDGWAQAIFGEQDLSVFGTQLEAFGTALVNYSTAMADVQTENIEKTTPIVDELVYMSRALGTDKWFSGTITFDEFGEQLRKFGEKFALFYGSISEVDAGTLSGVVSSISRLVGLARAMTDLDTSGMSSFGKALTNLAKADIEGVVTTYTDAYSRVESAVQGLVDAMSSSVSTYSSTFATSVSTMITDSLTNIRSQYPQFTTSGQELVTNLATGVVNNRTEAVKAFEEILTAILDLISQNGSDFNNAGQGLVKELVSGIDSQSKTASNSFTNVLSTMVTSIRNEYANFYNAGKYLVQGFANGISESTYLASAKAQAMAKAAETAAKNALGIHSPSTVFEEIGENTVEGYEKGIAKKMPAVVDSGEELGDNMIEATKQALDISTDSSKLAEKVIGESFVNGIAEGITSDMSAEEAAEKKAENIVQAFSNALEKIDFSGERLDLEDQLWNAQNENTASQAQKDAYQLETLIKQYQLQAQRLELAKAEYVAMVNEFGEGSQNAEESYNKFLQEQIDIANITNQIADLKESAIDRQKEMLDTQEEILQHQYEIWRNSQGGDNIRESMEKAGELGLLNSQYEIQVQRAKLAQLEYQSTLALFGTNANETYEAYSAYLAEYEELSGLYRDLSDSRKEQLKTDADAFNQYATYLAENQQRLDAQGVGLNDIQKEAIDNTDFDGFNLNKIIEGTALAFQSSTNTMIESLGGQVVATLDSSLSEATPTFEEKGAEYATAIGEGLSSNLDQITNSIGQILQNNVGQTNTSSDTFKSLGSSIMEGIASGMTESLPAVQESAALLADTIKTTINEALSSIEIGSTIKDLGRSEKDFSNVGTDLLTSFYMGMSQATIGEEQGLQQQGPGIVMVFDQLFVSLQEQFEETYYVMFYNAGVAFIVQIIEGMESEKGNLINRATTLLTQCYTAMYNFRPKFYSIGQMIIQAVVQAIHANAQQVVNAVMGVCQQAIGAARTALGIASPSKEFIEIGNYAMEGFVLGIKNSGSSVVNATESMAQTAINATKDAISRLSDAVTNGIDTEPTIRPVLDLSNVESGTRRINAMFSRNQALSISSRMSNGSTSDPENQNGVNTTPGGTVYTFTQNNYSPKALSRIEIYRQTNNQFSAMVRRTQTT